MSALANRVKVPVAVLTISAAAFGAWKAHEGYSDVAIIPVKGDVPTIGHGSTRYEDGTRVKMGDRITKERAEELAKNLLAGDEKEFIATLPGVYLTQGEFDIYIDFVGQYGIGAWKKSSMRKHLLAGSPIQACYALGKYRYVAGYDCSTPFNRQCPGVWNRQLGRIAQCLQSQ